MLSPSGAKLPTAVEQRQMEYWELCEVFSDIDISRVPDLAKASEDTGPKQGNKMYS